MENNEKEGLLYMSSGSYGNVNQYCCIDIGGDEVIYTICASGCMDIYEFDQN